MTATMAVAVAFLPCPLPSTPATLTAATEATPQARTALAPTALPALPALLDLLDLQAPRVLPVTGAPQALTARRDLTATRVPRALSVPLALVAAQWVLPALLARRDLQALQEPPALLVHMVPPELSAPLALPVPLALQDQPPALPQSRVHSAWSPALP